MAGCDIVKMTAGRSSVVTRVSYLGQTAQWRGEGFESGGSTRTFTLAPFVRKLTTCCSRCGGVVNDVTIRNLSRMDEAYVRAHNGRGIAGHGLEHKTETRGAWSGRSTFQCRKVRQRRTSSWHSATMTVDPWRRRLDETRCGGGPTRRRRHADVVRRLFGAEGVSCPRGRRRRQLQALGAQKVIAKM